MAASGSESEGEFASAESDTEEVSQESVKGQDCTAEGQRSSSQDDNSGDRSPPIPTKGDDDLAASTPPAPDSQPPTPATACEVTEEDESRNLHPAKSAEQPEVSATDDSDNSDAHHQSQTLASDIPGQPAASAIPEQPVKSAPQQEAPPTQQQEPVAPDPGAKAAGGGWGGWGGWGGSLWSSVSSVAESAQAIGQKVTAVIASVEDSLGVPSPEELAQGGTEEDDQLDPEVRRLAEDVKEHDVLEPIREEPHHQEGPPAEELPLDQEVGGEMLPSSTNAGSAEEPGVGGVSGFLSGFAAAVQSTSQGLMSGGLGALETIGKKTMEVLSEGDPGLAKKRAMLGVGYSPTLSQLLKEAKTEGAVARQVGEGGEQDSTHSPPNYSRFFDEYHGVGHLEALELLSRECAGKTHSACAELSEGDIHSLQEKLAKLTEHFTIEDDQDNLEDDSSQLEEVKELFSNVALPLKVDKLAKVSSGWREKVATLCAVGEGGEGGVSRSKEGESRGDEEGGRGEAGEEDKGEQEESEGVAESVSDKQTISETLYENGLRSLAEMTSTAIELFRKMAEISLLPDLPQSEPLSQAQKFNRLTMLVSNELDALASVHSEAITQLDLEGTNASVTSLYLESSNSGSYVQDAFQLLLPVLKLLLVQQLQVAEPAPDVLSRS